MTKTTITKGGQVARKWHLIDLNGQTLGRICTKIAQILMGKHNPNFSYHRDDGDYVVAINAASIKVTGRKLVQKIYYRYSNFPGGLSETSLKEQLRKDPTRVIYHGVHGMIPKNKLRAIRMARLKIFPNETHPYAKNINH